MSYKDGGAKQSQDYRDRFGHLTHPATILLLRVVGDPGFRMASSGPENVSCSAGQAKTAHPPHWVTAQRARGFGPALFLCLRLAWVYLSRRANQVSDRQERAHANEDCHADGEHKPDKFNFLGVEAKGYIKNVC